MTFQSTQFPSSLFIAGQNQAPSLSTFIEQVEHDLLLCKLEKTTVITLNGPDAVKYLQGQVSCDVNKLTSNTASWGAHCDDQGKVWSLFLLWQHAQGLMMLTDKAVCPSSITALQKYAVFSQVEITQTQYAVFGLMGKQLESWLNQHSEGNGDVRTLKMGGYAVKVNELRWYLILTADQATRKLQATIPSTQHFDDGLWQYADIEMGRVHLTQELTQTYLPQSLHIDQLGAIDFDKGCYIGQEMIARAKYRGINKRKLVRISGGTQHTSLANCAFERCLNPEEIEANQKWRTIGPLLNTFQFTDQQATGVLILPSDINESALIRLVDHPQHTWSIQPFSQQIDSSTAEN